jgi:CRP-like cAMP-binding protein
MKELKLFFNLNDSELKSMLDFSYKKNYNKKEILFYADEEVNHFYFLSEGSVVAYQVDNNNKKIVWHIFQAPCLIGEGFVLQGKKRKTAFNTEWLSDGSIIKIDNEKFERHYMQNSKVLLVMLKSVSLKLANYRHFVLNEKFFSISEKIAYFMIHYPALAQSLKLGEISDILNIQQATLSRVLKEFREEGLIEEIKYKIILKDEEKLHELYQNKFD